MYIQWGQQAGVGTTLASRETQSCRGRARPKRRPLSRRSSAKIDHGGLQLRGLCRGKEMVLDPEQLSVRMFSSVWRQISLVHELLYQ